MNRKKEKGMINSELINWLLDGDPSIIYQVHRDLLNTDKEQLEILQQNISKSGWVHDLLQKQADNWIWGNGLYSPKWISSTYTLLLLKRLSLSQDNTKAIKGAQVLLDQGLNKDGGINFSKTIDNSETCITGLVLYICSYFNLNDKKIFNLIDYLLNEQMEDGGWNCQKINGAAHSSMHTTINVLEGLLEFKNNYRYKINEIIEAENKAHEFLLKHKLYKSDKTYKIIDRKFTYLSFPPRWYYDILRVMDYFYNYNKEYDLRMGDALRLIIKKKNQKNRWPSQGKHPGKEYFELEKDTKNSRINTLRALRILNKYDRYLEEDIK